MKKLLFLLVLVAAYYFQGRYLFSHDAAQRWVAQHASRALSGDQSACDDFSDDTVVNIRADSAAGTWEVEGGKNEVCGYMKQASAGFTVMQASLNTDYRNFVVEPQDFFWRKVRISYVETTSISAAHIPTMKSISHDTLLLGRGLSGIKILSLTSNSEM